MTREITSVINSSVSPGIRQVLFVCGLGGSGKTKFCDEMQTNLGRQSVIVRTDWYLTHSSLNRRERIQHALDTNNSEVIEQESNPENWYNWDKFKTDLEVIRDTGMLQLSGIWNQQTGEKDLSVELQVATDGLIICDGIYLLNPVVRRYADIAILLEVSPETAKARAEQRDQHRSSGTYLMFKDSLMQKYDLPYFEEYKRSADIIIDNNDFDLPKLVKALGSNSNSRSK